MDLEADFSGYVVKYNIKNENGYSIAKDAFKEQDGKFIALVNNFYEGIPIGVCLLSSDDIGLYGRCFLKNNPNAKDIFHDLRKSKVDAFIINLEDIVTVDNKNPKMILSGTIKNVMIDQHENSKYVSSIDFINDYVPDEKTKKESSTYKKITLTKDDIKDPHDFHALPWTVDVLGTRYNIKSVDKNTDDKRLEGANAYCDDYAKEIVVKDYMATERSFKDILSFNRRVLRHEIVHAFLAESGLRRNCNWACEEEMVDWIAIQFPKMLKAFQEANAINSEDFK